MSIKIKISYQADRELEEVVKLLSPILKDCKKSSNQEGKYRKAYLELKPSENLVFNRLY